MTRDYQQTSGSSIVPPHWNFSHARMLILVVVSSLLLNSGVATRSGAPPMIIPSSSYDLHSNYHRHDDQQPFNVDGTGIVVAMLPKSDFNIVSIPNEKKEWKGISQYAPLHQTGIQRPHSSHGIPSFSRSGDRVVAIQPSWFAKSASPMIDEAWNWISNTLTRSNIAPFSGIEGSRIDSMIVPTEELSTKVSLPTSSTTATTTTATATTRTSTESTTTSHPIVGEGSPLIFIGSAALGAVAVVGVTGAGAYKIWKSRSASRRSQQLSLDMIREGSPSGTHSHSIDDPSEDDDDDLDDDDDEEYGVSDDKLEVGTDVRFWTQQADYSAV